MKRDDVQQSEEKVIQANGINLAYDTFGEPTDPAMLLIMGLGAQMISWDERFCKLLAGRGYWVIRFDNRDIGLSSHFGRAGIPDIPRLLSGEPTEVPYKLIDMAQDAIGLMDALKIEKAHLVGASMGGMIAQTITIHYPERVLSLTSMISTTSDPQLPPARPEAQSLLFAPSPLERAEFIEYEVMFSHTLGGSRFPIDETRVREIAERVFERGVDPGGVARQFAAIIASGSRTVALKSVQTPTLVIHGSADPLIPVEAGIATAKAIPGSKLEIIEGMGHELPPQIWPQLVDLISNHAA